MIEPSHVEPHADVPTRLNTLAVNSEPSADNMDSNNVKVGTGNGPAVSSKMNPTDVEVAAVPASVDHVAPMRVSKSKDTMQASHPYTMTFAECGSDSYDRSGSGWIEKDCPTMPRLEKKKGRSVVEEQPVITAGMCYL